MSIEDAEGKGEVENEQSKKHEFFQGRALCILKAVYGGAVKSIPSSVGLRQRLFEIVEATNLAQSEHLKRQILDDMNRDFSTLPEYGEWLTKIERSFSGTGDDVSNVSQLQRAIKAITANLSEEDIKGLKLMFSNIDTDKSGMITCEELKSGLTRLASKLSEAEVKQLMEAADMDGNGTIDYIEFMKQCGMGDDSTIREIISEVDTDNIS